MTSDRAFELAEAARAERFRHYAFISYPNTDEEMRRFARKFRDSLECLLRRHFPELEGGNDYVFLDERGLSPGTVWEQHLAESLCRSLTLVALCVPMYSHPRHDWCGREWSAMRELSEARLPAGMTAIFPVRLGDPLHAAIAEIQQFSAPRKALRWLPRSNEFDSGLELVLKHILRVMECRVGSAENCPGYRIPERSAFIAPPPPPLLPNRASA